MEEAAERFDWVVLDAGPIGPTTDPRVLAALVDGAIFVVRAGVTQFDEVQKGIDALGRDHLLGVVLNGVDAVSTIPYYGAR
jgi:polysaccharide biosynthesis transport protein